jgi:hypothetical protein
MTQDEYIAILFDDCGFNGAQRRDFLGSRYDGRRYADQLTAAEKHGLIEDLKERKPIPPAAEKEDDNDEDAERTAKERAELKRRKKESMFND